MSEGHVYVCKWEKLPSGSIEGRIPQLKLRAEGASIKEVTSQLSTTICLTIGDGEAVFEFEPPLTRAGNAEWFADNIVTVSPNAHFRFEDVSNLTTSGFCPLCKWPLGTRTDQKLKVRSMWPGEAVFSWDPSANGVRLLLCSEKILDLFSDEDRQAFEVRDVVLPAKKRKRFFEIVPKSFVAEVLIDSLKKTGWHCKECGRQNYSHGAELGWGVHIISRKDLTATGIFFVGDSLRYSLAMRGERWDLLKDKLREFDIKSEALAIVNR